MASVLVVDDDKSMRGAICLVLTGEGHDVDEAANGLEALARLRDTSQPTVVLLDLMMPLMGGKGVLDAVEADPALAARHAFILMTASWPLEASLDDTISRMGVPFLPKPFKFATMEAAVARAAARLAERRALVGADGVGVGDARPERTDESRSPSPDAAPRRPRLPGRPTGQPNGRRRVRAPMPPLGRALPVLAETEMGRQDAGPNRDTGEAHA